MTRKPGSGLHNAATAAVERLVAAVFANTNVTKARNTVDQFVQKGRCGIDADVMCRWIKSIARDSDLAVVDAETPAPDGLGDVRLTLVDGTFVWIEVKAQTTKFLRDLMQADWVRDETDALRHLLQFDPSFADLSSEWVRESLEVHDPRKYFKGWSFADLWVCDLALLPNRARRASAGVAVPRDLPSFLCRKHILHIARDGARMVRLDRLPAVEHVLDGGPVHIAVAPGGKADVKVSMSTLGPPRRGSTEFVYYTGYADSGALGRHKLTDLALSRADDVLRSGA